MDAATVLKQVAAGRIIAILRGDYRGRETEIVSTIAAAGVTAVEVTLNSPAALTSIARLVKEFGAMMAVGAGTVLSVEDVRKVADLGAGFVVSPNRNVDVIHETKSRGLASFPGCFTPSEMIEATAAGADAVKLFPAVTLGVAFVKALRGPLPEVRTIPTGGIDPAAARQYIAAGAFAVGIGSDLLGSGLFADGGMDRLSARAAAFVAAVREA
jgi:Entner-Doudoroff aldolase